MMPKVDKSKDQWQQELSAEQFYVLREEGTERAFTSPLNDEKTRRYIRLCRMRKTVV